MNDDSTGVDAAKTADIIQTEEGSNAGSAREEIELRKMLLVLPTIEDAESGHIPDDKLTEDDVNENSAPQSRAFSDV